MPRRFVVALVLLGWSLGLANHALALSAEKCAVTSIGETAQPATVWVQPSNNSRDLVRPPARNSLALHVSPAARTLWRGATLVSEVSPRAPAPSRPSTPPSRRLLRHTSSSSDDATPA